MMSVPKANRAAGTLRSSFSFPYPPLSLPELVYKSSSVLTVHAISHYSPDVLKGHAVVALPLAFLGMHQAPGPDEEKGEGHDAALWAEVWQDNVPGEKRLFIRTHTSPTVVTVVFISFLE